MDFLKSQGQIETGVFAEAEGITYEDGGNVLQAATDAEFGIEQPMRSWLRAWFDENQSQIESQLAAQMRLAFKRGETFEWAAERVALWLQADIQKRVTQGIDPPNHPLTVAKKGSSTPLIDSGLLRSAIVSHFNGKAVA